MEHDEEHKEEKEVEKIVEKKEEKEELKENTEEIKKEHNYRENITKKMRENPWVLSTFALGVVVLILLIGNFFGGMTGNIISERNAGDYLVDYLSSSGYDGFELENVKSEDSIYVIETIYEEDSVLFYVTKTGYIIGDKLVSIIPQDNSNIDSQIQDIPKSDKPEVELFIMTHCPYGTQAEKGFIPAIKALGNTIDAQIRFVHYFMHEPEETETPRQVCIREEQSSKYLDYLECFLEDGDYDRCLSKTGINMANLNICLESKAEQYYAEDSELSEEYGVRGSPTLVINGEIVSSGRDSASYLNTICQAFNDAPEECGLELSSASPSPGFGTGTGSETSAQC